MEKIKFREVFLQNKDNTFSHFSYWGLINHKHEFAGGCFTGQSQSNMAHRIANNQYIKLNDKNDVETFEGDICAYGNQIVKVVYSTSFCSFRFVNKYFGSCITDDEDFEYEIIGNMYQNPELKEEC